MKKLVFTLSLIGLLIACDSDKSKNEQQNKITKSDVKREFKKVLDTSKTYLSQEKDALVRKLNKQIAATENEIDKLKHKLNSAKEAQKKQLNNKIESLESQVKELKQQTDKLKNSSESAFEELKTGTKNAAEELNKALDSAKNEF